MSKAPLTLKAAKSTLEESESSSKSMVSSTANRNGHTTETTNNCTGTNASSKLSKIGRRIRESCRNLRGKHSNGGASSNPDDYSSVQAKHDSSRSTHYVPMDFSGKTGRIVSHKDVAGRTTKEGYTYFRRKVEPTNVDHLLTETQAGAHKLQPWYHKGVGREVAQKILASHSIEGLFLVRESSVAGGYVISYYYGTRAYHVPIMPEASPAVTFSLDSGRTRFYDLLQLVEFYQLNKGTLHTRLTHYIVNRAGPDESSSSSAESCRNASDGSLDSKDEAVSMTSSTVSKIDSNHNSRAKNGSTVNMESEADNCSDDGENSVATAVDANMEVSEGENDQEGDDQADKAAAER